MKLLPPASSALIEQLEALYPARCIMADETLESAHRYAGKRELIDWLRVKLDQTEEHGTRRSLGG